MNKQKAKKLGRKLNRELIEGEDLHARLAKIRKSLAQTAIETYHSSTEDLAYTTLSLTYLVEGLCKKVNELSGGTFAEEPVAP